ncbi:MAG: GTP-binding protein, partial [Candidatus Zixiibacteriota bacterium]
MKEFTTDKIRNVCLSGQRGSGKTSLADTIAFVAGINNRVGRVDDGTSLFDYTEAEISRKTSLTLKLLAISQQDIKINLLDTPGHTEFLGELMVAARVANSVGILVDAAAGVEIGTQLQWRAIPDTGIARFFFVNKMDKENAKWKNCLESIQNRFGKAAAAIQIPMGDGDAFTGVIDLLKMKAYTFDKDGKKSESEIPANLKDEAQSARESLMEAAAESDDALIEKFFNDGTLSDADIIKGLRSGIASSKLYPVLFGSVAKNIGVRT